MVWRTGSRGPVSGRLSATFASPKHFSVSALTTKDRKRYASYSIPSILASAIANRVSGRPSFSKRLCSRRLISRVRIFQSTFTKRWSFAYWTTTIMRYLRRRVLWLWSNISIRRWRGWTSFCSRRNYFLLWCRLALSLNLTWLTWKRLSLSGPA